MEDKILNNKLKTISTNTLIIGMGAIVSKGAAFIIAFVLANFYQQNNMVVWMLF